MEIASLKLTTEWRHYHFLNQLDELMKLKDVRWDYAFSEDQLLSKIWIVQILKDLKMTNLNNVMILGGWFGMLGSILLASEEIKVTKIRSFDLDEKLERIADLFNVHHVADAWKFKAAQGDWNHLNFDVTEYRTHRFADNSPVDCKDKFDTIINTCCEHSDNLEKWLCKVPSDRLLVLQSNSSPDYEGHVNSCPRLEDFIQKASLTRTLFAGVLSTPRYNRWMLIGYR